MNFEPGSVTEKVEIIAMDGETLELLEFDQVRQILAGLAQSPPGRQLALQIEPLSEFEAVNERLEAVREALCYADEKGRLSLGSLADLSGILSRLSLDGEVLDPSDFLLLRDCLELSRQVKKKLDQPDWPRLRLAVRQIPEVWPLLEKLDRILDRRGEIREAAHPELRKVRLRQKRVRARIETSLAAFLSGPQSKFLIPDPFVTQRSGRFVIPVRVEHQKEIPGIAHASSSSGATLFIEPLSCIDLNNELLLAQDREREILYQLLRDLSYEFRKHRPLLVEAVENLADIDFLFSCAAFARRFRCAIPTLNRQGLLLLGQARHPLLLASLGLEKVAPISVRLDSGQNVLIISGPNTGGKTVALKTIGLICLMAQSGLPVPAADANLPVLKTVLADIGDHQSIAERLSTFSAHIERMKKFMAELEPPCLILLDELGRGTDPVHGAALGIALTDYFRSHMSLVVATTHYQAVKSFAASTPGVSNASVELDSNSLRPTYELHFGVAGSSSGLQIASQLGLDLSVVARARELLDEKELQVERYLEKLRLELRVLEREKTNLESLKLRLEEEKRELGKKMQRQEREREKQFEAFLEELTSEFRQEAEKQIRRFQDRFQAARAREESKRRQALLKEAFRRRRREQMETRSGPAPSDSPDIRTGDQVYHFFFRKQGKVVSIENRQAVVEIEGKKVETPLEQLRRSDPRPVVRRPSRNVTLNVVEQMQREINLIGNTVEEALSKLDKFLDRAFVAQLPQVRIIHGFGTGRLKSALAEALKTHPQVEKFELEGGITSVTLKI